MSSEMQSVEFLSKLVVDLSSTYFETLGGPTALGLYLCLKYKDHKSACSHTINPHHYISELDFRSDYLAANFLSKYEGGHPSDVRIRKVTALSKFYQSEERLRDVYAGLKVIESGSMPALTEVFFSARERIRQTLGPIKDVFNVYLCDFGPGSSTSVPRSKAHPANKYVSADVSQACAPLVDWYFQTTHFPRPLLNVVGASRIECVPKNFKTDRIIAVEPDWNIFFQKGVGSAIRGRLKRRGIDLDNGSDLHQRLTYQASRCNDLATIDLSSASDSISTQLIRWLLPDDWFVVMNSIRTDAMKMADGTILPLRKFSSMGNGFTFELESLVFYELAVACAKFVGTSGTVSVFGDDIILPKEAVKLLEATLTHVGFLFNTEKSFASGYFRESCGAHYFNGLDTKPIYLKRDLKNDSEKFKLCNKIRELAIRCGHPDIKSGAFSHVYNACKRSIRRVFLIPAGMGISSGLVSTFDEARPSIVRRKGNITPRANGFEGFKVRCLLPKTREGKAEHHGMMMYKLRKLGRNPSSFHNQSLLFFGQISLSDLIKPDKGFVQSGNLFFTSVKQTEYRIGHVHVQQWLDPISY